MGFQSRLAQTVEGCLATSLFLTAHTHQHLIQADCKNKVVQAESPRSARLALHMLIFAWQEIMLKSCHRCVCLEPGDEN